MYVTGFGDSGPRSADPAYDGLLQTLSGLAYVQGGGESPELLHTFMADKVAAMLATQAILAALLERGTGSVGKRLSISLLDAVAYFNFSDLLTRRTQWDSNAADLDGVSQAMRPIRTKDGWILVSPVSGAQIGRAFTAIGHPEFKEVLLQYKDRSALASKLVELLESATPAHTTAHWLDKLADVDVPAAPVLTIDQHLADPQVVASQIYGQTMHPRHGLLRDVKYPVEFEPGHRVATYRPAPALGEHTAEVFERLEQGTESV
jgi:crotonobetainyl-CoA:carnitine CoA-transferase CaiB-like acyl-CoA transferase